MPAKSKATDVVLYSVKKSAYDDFLCRFGSLTTDIDAGQCVGDIDLYTAQVVINRRSSIGGYFGLEYRRGLIIVGIQYR